ncbi:MAG: YheC/YheD family protein [Gorillibacterium sp.]|nr:YheC/YheD family protein [Gorillibacterium sp.]
MEQRSALPNNKLGKTKYLIMNDELKDYLPDTIVESKNNLQLFLTKYKTVYVKPNNGTGGRGVMRVKVRKDGTFVYQLGLKEHRFADFDQLYHSLSKYTSQKRHLIQKGIPLLKVDHRPFDIRIMVQRYGIGYWVCTGIIARLAYPKKIITNYHGGGTPLPLEGLLANYLSPKEIPAFIQNLKDLGQQISVYLAEGLPHVTAMGVDIGLDTNLKPWIIEVNTKPDPYIFNQLKDKTMYRLIMQYIKYNRSNKNKRN